MMMRSTTAAAALALLLLASTASAEFDQLCGACTVVDCDCSVCALDPVDMGAAARFVILAGAGATSSGPTELTGDLGVSPDPGTVTGAPVLVSPSAFFVGNCAPNACTTDNDSVAGRGFAALNIAYHNASDRVQCPISIIGNLGGLTLYPGLYKSSSGFEITGSDLTLDAKGNASAVFIFQMASTFLITTGNKIILTNATGAENVFWQVGTSATLQVGTVVEGTLMADQSISSMLNVVIHGRALARIASVTMESAKFSLPPSADPSDDA